MKPRGVAIVGAAETDVGVLPHLSEPDLHARAAAMALADAGLTPADVDGIATAWHSPIDIAHHIGVTPSWHDGTTVGGCSFLVHVGHAAAAIDAGLCTTVLVLHGESGRSRIGRPSRRTPPDSLSRQFEAPYGVRGAVTAFTLPALRFLHETGTTREQMAAVPAVQSRWAHGNPRAWRAEEFTVEDVLASRVVAWPFHKLECCPVTDGGAALVLTAAERAADLPRTPVHLLGAGEAGESPLVAHMEDLTSSRAFRESSRRAFAQAGVTVADVDHLMVYDPFAHLPLYGLEDLGFVGRGEAGAFVADGNTAPGGSLPMNTNGGGLCYTHTGMYGMFAIQESVRQLRGDAHRQVDGVEISVVQGVGGIFTSAATLVLADRPKEGR
ncbi:thiolase [Actinomadura madurae]|uniref:thiolase C-terminal domain-containing protein n=1 Tax=Actinomadura madurae TaxID=1993 RepID=UPI00399ADE3D